MASEEGPTLAALESWKSSLSPLRVDIVSDFAGKELFAIHGESLVAHCVAQAKVDFKDGFQLLHAVHAVETFLSKLQERGCNFHVLWFDSQEQLCVPHDVLEKSRHKYLLTRAVLMEHLRTPKSRDEKTRNPWKEDSSDDSSDASTDPPTDPIRNGTPMSFVFSTIQSKEFEEYMEKNCLHFVMCSQGSDFDSAPEVNDGVGSGNHLKAMRLFADQGHNLAFIDDIELRSSKVYTHVVTSARSEDPIEVTEPTPRSVTTDGWVEFASKFDDWSELEPVNLNDTTEVRVRDEIAFVACASLFSAKPDAATEQCVTAFLIHIELLEHTELAQRSCGPLEESIPDDAASFLEGFSNIAIPMIRKWMVSSKWMGAHVNWSVCDLLDGRVFLHILQKLRSMKLAVEFHHFEYYDRRIRNLVDVDMERLLSQQNPPNEQSASKAGPNFKRLNIELKKTRAANRVLPFSHPVLDSYLGEIWLDTDEECQKSSPGSKIFQELTHWHNAKRPIDAKAPSKPMEWRAHRRMQRFMADTMKYSASLTNASGKNIEPEHLVAHGTRNNGQADNEKDDAAAKYWKKQLSKKDAAKAVKRGAGSGAINARKAGKELKNARLDSRGAAVVTFFAQQCQDFNKIQSPAKRYLKANRYMLGLSDQDRQTFGGELLLYICETLLELLGEPPFIGRDMSIIALLRSHLSLMNTVPLTKPTRRHLESLAHAMRLPPPPSSDSTAIDRPIPFASKTAIAKEVMKRGFFEEKAARKFQLEHCGPYLERSFDSAPDGRVPFAPDAWQRKVLDAIDEDKSLFVVAPTSAGKTFISFYAMKKVLQANDDDVLVYVAPTKALVNQIAAEIQGRFSKTYHTAGRSIWAIHTRDYRINNPTGCQVLVTVPHILQIMLLAPSNAKKSNSWSHRVKRIIFDEVHCIGQAEDGIIWEQLLLLALCPIIALSATVGNPLEFKEWVAGTQKAKGFDLEMVVHSARYSDLRKFMYQPPDMEQWRFNGLEPVERLPTPGLDVEGIRSDRFVFVHPVGSIVDKSKETLNDVSLEPRDCLQLWGAMIECANDSYPVDRRLDPASALPDVVKKSDVVEWEVALKEQLHTWMADPSSPYPDLRKKFDASSKPSTDVKKTIETTFPLLIDLRSRGALPAILFNYDRVGCEMILSEVLQRLEKAEEKYRAESPEWHKKLRSYQKWQDGLAAKKSKSTKSSGSRRDDKDDGTAFGKLDHLREDSSQEASQWASFDPSAPIEQFSFADSTKLSRGELEEMIDNLAYANIKKPILNALRRGLGVHHAGMNRQYRQVVEMLFRKGFLTAVIATGTLALGLNMPCKTVVFVGDSPFLTALNYRQASGRAGRRGFDLLGNVVFHGIRHQRAMEIMSSRLPDLRGQFPMSVTLILRLFGLLHGTNDSDFAKKAVQSLLTQTRLFLGGPSSQLSIKHHLRFSIEYLRRQHLLSANGAPLNFSGLVGHLYFTENAAFALHSLMKGGYLHELCEGVNDISKRKDMLLELLTVLCHLFCRVPCFRYMNKEWLEKVVHRSPSVVILPKLPERAERLLTNHNRETLNIFLLYVRSYIKKHLRNVPDDVLPFTKRRVQPGCDFAPHDMSAINIPILPATTIRSPFAALSGFADDFETIHELCETVRSGVFLEEESIPYIPITLAETNNVPFNAYILDFFKHGDMEALVRDNGIKRGDVWFHLKDFSLVLATIVTSLANFLDKSGAEFDDASMIDVMDVADIIDGEADNVEDECFNDTRTSETSEAVGKAQKIRPKPKPKSEEEVPESWMDSDDSDNDANESSDMNGSTDESSGDPPSRDEDDETGLVKVYRAFRLLQQEFDEKFRKVWA
ncbi:DEAD/DEAH box helicase [Colletotrichum asianum]|uniref:DEAD/DEAH box helicase n=1 Tax=Colletotrichum asianum TaxID=702518 RepID=A0A8H3W6W5_9PEZI|nr:DEAD/DEAH box helicase [Colletotrichum asianum]